MCSGLMVVGHRLDCYSLLSVVFAVFLGLPGHGSLAQDILSLSSRSSSRCAFLQLGPFVMPCLSGYSSPSSVCSLSRTALIVSLLRYVAFLFRHLVCLVPSHGGQGHVYQKALRAKSKKIHRTNILHPHPPSTSPLYPTHSRLFPPLSPCPPTVIHQVADCLSTRCLWATTAISGALDHTAVLALPNHPRLPGLGTTDAIITINTSHPSPPSFPLPPSPRRWGIFNLPTALQAPSTLPCIKYFH